MRNPLLRLFLLLMSLSIISTYSYAKIWRVNNNPNVVTPFRTIQRACDSSAVVAGDTIHVEPSATPYGSLVLSKRLVIVGVGFFLNVDPDNQVRSDQLSTISSVLISSIAANGAVLTGIDVDSSITINGGVTGVQLRRCHTGFAILLNNAPNTVITGCFVGSLSLGPYIKRSIYITNSTNIIITNNICLDRIRVMEPSSATIVNNVISATGNGQGSYEEIHIANSTFQNNIIVKPQDFEFVNTVVQNNINSGTAPPNSSLLPTTGPNTGNQNGVVMTNVFVSSGGTTDKDYVLKAGSPALGAGINGEDMGGIWRCHPL